MPQTDDIFTEFESGVKFFLRLIQFSKKIGLEKQVANLKGYLLSDFAESLHEGVVHSMRDFAIDLISSGDAHEEHTSISAKTLCSASREAMSKVIELPPNQLHCCLKGFSKNNGNNEIVTWARSNPLDDRPVGINDAHPIDGNTVWCSLLGRDDGHTSWQPYNCFVSNNLPENIEHFKCSRQDWSSYYQSALVYPLRYFKKIDRRHVTVGFLAFDSPNKDAFIKMPDIFNFRDGGAARCEYHDLLNRSATFHTGAAIADTLSMVMRPFYEDKELEN